MHRLPILRAGIAAFSLVLFSAPCLAQLVAGAAKVDVTDYQAGPVNDPLYVKALVLEHGKERFAIVTVDAVAI